MIDWQSAKKFLSNPEGIGAKIVYLPETPSTQIPAKDAARRGAAHGTVFVTEHQTAGRGRRDRRWQSVPGRDLMFSVVLRPDIDMSRLPILNFALAVSVARFLEHFAGVRGVGLKWPNDVLVMEKKICGMICDVSACGKRLAFAVAGIGVNVNRTAGEMPRFEEGRREATSILIETGHKGKLPELLGALMSELDTAVSLVCREEGSALLLEEYKNRCVTLGRHVEIVTDDGNFSGTAVDITEQGAIRIDGPSGSRSFDAGDVVHAAL